MHEEIALIAYHYQGVSLSEAWALSYLERVILVDQLRKIHDEQQQKLTGKKILRASDFK